MGVNGVTGEGWRGHLASQGETQLSEVHFSMLGKWVFGIKTP